MTGALGFWRSRPPPAEGPKRTRTFAWLLWLVPIYTYARQALRFESWLVDDAGITFAYARNLADGHGLVAQPGALPVEGYSNPLWLLILAIGKLLHLFDSGTTLAGAPDYVWFPKAVSFLCFVGTLLAYQRAFAFSMGRRAAYVVSSAAGLLLSAIPSYVAWSMSGLENALFGLLLVALAALLADAAARGTLATPRVALRAALVAFAAMITRPDGLAYIPAYPCFMLWFLRPPIDTRAALRAGLTWLATSVVTVGGFLALRQLLFHAWLPNTAVAKQRVPSLTDLNRMFEPIGYLGWSVALCGAVVVGAACLRGGEAAGASRRALTTFALMTLVALASFALLEPDWMAELRFATPVWALGAGLLAAATYDTLSNPGLEQRTRALLAGLLALSGGTTWPSLEARFVAAATYPTLPLCHVADQYRLFNLHGDKLRLVRGALVLPDLGGSSLISAYALVDIGNGLLSAKIARLYRNADNAGLDNYLLDEVKPVLLHRHGAWLPRIHEDPRFARDYLELVPGQDYVRRDALVGRAFDEAKLREEAERMTRSIHAHYAQNPRRACGERLLPGSLPEPRLLVEPPPVPPPAPVP